MAQNQYLNYLSKINSGFIHPKGEASTDILLSELDIKENETILELGFGTGSTLIKILTLTKKVKLYGLEKSPLMLKKALARLRFCGVKDCVNLNLLNIDNSIPFESNFFDKIYVESVLSIQEGEDLVSMLSELSRVLKTNGVLCINELLWSPNTDQDKINSVNAFVKEKFGIIQANGKYKSIEDWLNLMESRDFRIKISKNISNIPMKRSFKTRLLEIRSLFFSILGKIKRRVNSKLKKESIGYDNAMSLLNKDYKLEPYLIVAYKK
ncbi:class I SAM-dependent methyltransferase [Tenacibaculum xiamenense]|uniref:class I SAM-dependent methyltransferase n=1 Tax=Tenacibaculum xiamenense TaxID=1261553 RepID=UPI0038944608